MARNIRSEIPIISKLMRHRQQSDNYSYGCTNLEHRDCTAIPVDVLSTGIMNLQYFM